VLVTVAVTLGGMGVLWLGVRSPAALLLCACLAGWLLSAGGPVSPPAAVSERLAPMRERVHAFGADLEARWRCDIATRRAFADGSEEAVALAERWCPSAGDPLPEDRKPPAQ
jgi:hypothetical protein